MSLSPSAARTYLVPTAANTGAGYYVPSSIVVATKSSADIIDYTFDFTNWLSGTFDSIVGPVSLSGPLADGAYPVTLTESAINGNLVTFVLASGQPNTTNILGLKVTTSQGRTVVVPFTLTVDGASPPTLAVVPTPTPSDSKSAVVNNSECSGNVTLTPDVQGRDIAYNLTITGDTTLSLGAVTFNTVRQVVYVKLTQTGAYTVSLPSNGANFEWMGNSAPVIPTSSGTVYFQFVTYDGTNWVGFQAP